MISNIPTTSFSPGSIVVAEPSRPNVFQKTFVWLLRLPLLPGMLGEYAFDGTASTTSWRSFLDQWRTHLVAVNIVYNLFTLMILPVTIPISVFRLLASNEVIKRSFKKLTGGIEP